VLLAVHLAIWPKRLSFLQLAKRIVLGLGHGHPIRAQSAIINAPTRHSPRHASMKYLPRHVMAASTVAENRKRIAVELID
jgi:hypothetical protein